VRRNKLEKPLSFAIITLLIALTFPSCKNKPIELSKTETLLGTFVEIKVITEDRKRGEEAIEKAFSRMKEIEKRMSNFLADSELSRLNRKAGKEEVEVSEELASVIVRGLSISKKTEGAFDITVSPLITLWGFYRHRGNLPQQEELGATLKRVGWKKVTYNPKRRTIRFKEQGMAIDLGGIAKGYAVDEAVSTLKKWGITRALVNAGGDIYALGGGKNGKTWLIGIADPREKGRIIGTIRVRDRAVVTSGSYENYFEIGGKRYCHIIDPRTGYPVSGMASVTIIAKNATIADALATGIFVLRKKGGLSLIEQIPDAEGIIITDKGKIYFSSGMRWFHPSLFPPGVISVAEERGNR